MRLEKDVKTVEVMAQQREDENWQAYSNCSVCPIVFNVYEGAKQELWRRRRK